MQDRTPDVARHYGTSGLLDRMLAALEQAGIDLARLTIDDLAPMDEFHSRRRAATTELGALLAPTPADRIVDIGSGIGGPARYLAKTFGSQVSGVDLTQEFVDTATALTRMVGLTERVDFRQGSALDLPFADASFDLGWSQNVAMNIEDRARYYAEMHRVLKPGGRLAIQDVAQGPNGPIDFPVMWADRAEISFLRTPAETRTLLEAAGFQVQHWIDNTDIAKAESAAERARGPGAGGPPILGIHVVVGPSFREKLHNAGKAQADDRLRLLNAVLIRV
ncbi:MAG: methyltransferase domain-containing protein [Rhodospirillales bacterium]